ncbi:flippase [Heyndrickxia coagulans]|jgi:O-antigen/teichoic acid export membrane protein|uniref:flippase n=1 Tax=Heyndrickxia TaxID=2837504 RepID=UPI00062892F2|nr:flippase [Heyndrickxia coagulans]UXC22890.1 flippase [Heyndrickxia coagulans]
MEKSISIKKNMIMNIILTGSNFLFPLITFSYAARILQPEGTGKVAFAMSMLSYFSWIATLGIPMYGIRQCAKVRNNRYELSKCVQELFTINIFSTILAYVVLFVALFIVPEMHQEKELYVVISIQMLLNTIGMEWVYQALEKYSYITIRSIIFKCVSVVLILVLVKNPDDYILYGGLNIIASSASNIVNFIHIRKYVSFTPIKHKEYRKHLRPIMTLLASTVIITIYSNFDVVMIGFLKGDNVVGMYNAALKIKNIVLSTSTAITAVIIPRMSTYYQNNDINKFRELGLKSLMVSTIFAFPLATFILINSSDVLSFISGSSYIPASNTLRILMLCTYALIITNLFGVQFLIPMGMESRYSQSVFIGLFINIILNFLLIPSFGSAGAAVGTLVTEIFNVYWMSKGIPKERNFIIKSYNFRPYFWGIFVAVFLNFIAILLMPNYNTFLRLIILSFIFFGAYYVTLLLLKESLLLSTYNKYYKKMMKKNK